MADEGERRASSWHMVRRAILCVLIGAMTTWCLAWFVALLQDTPWDDLVGPTELRHPPGRLERYVESYRVGPDGPRSDVEITHDVERIVDVIVEEHEGSEWSYWGLEDPRRIVRRPADVHFWVVTPPVPRGFGRRIEIGHVAGYVDTVNKLHNVSWSERIAQARADRRNAVGPPLDLAQLTRDARRIGTVNDCADEPSWSVFAVAPPAHWENLVVVQSRWGWPLPCLYSTAWASPGGAGTRRYTPLDALGADLGLPTHALPVRKDGGETHLPLGVLPVGLALNALIHGCVLWLCWTTVSYTRAHLRSRRGLCERCGHIRSPSSAQNVCPECGSVQSSSGQHRPPPQSLATSRTSPTARTVAASLRPRDTCD